MRAIVAVRSALCALVASVLFAPGMARGQTDYNWSATGGGGLGMIDPGPGGLTIIPVPAPTSVDVSLSYTFQAGLTGVTIGDTTTFNDAIFQLGITGTGSPTWPSFFTVTGQSVSLTVPSGGQGLDMLAFSGLGDIGAYGSSFGAINLYAPAGTLSTSTQLPADLSAFNQFAMNNTGDLWGFSPSGVGYLGNASGSIGTQSTPEPSSVWLLGLGAAGALGYAVRRRRSS